MGLDLLLPDQDNRQMYGVTIAIVTNNQDPEGLGRVKVKFPWLSDQDESNWARVVSFMAGKDRGMYCLPEVDDEVLVAFERGDIEFPYVLGSLWNGVDTPPAKNDDGKNNQRLFKSRSGHQIILDDTADAEQIIIQDKTGNNKITIDSKNNALNIQVEQDITIEAKGKITFKSTDQDIELDCQNLSIKTQKNCQIESGANCTIKAKAKGEFESRSGMAINCAAGVKINRSSLEVM